MQPVVPTPSACGTGSMSEPSPPPLATAVPLVFQGSASEYFRIWIVNLFLSIVTFGVYSAWAKVRRLRYFYGNLRLAGHGFDFVGDPKRIFYGRIIATLFLFGLAVCEKFMGAGLIWVILYVGLVLAMVGMIPWIVTRGRQFMLHNTLHRNLRFRFQGSLGEAYLTLLGHGMLSLLTFGLYVPFFLYHYQAFLINNSSFGSARFTMTQSRKEFVIRYGIAIALGILFYLAMVGLVVLILILLDGWNLQYFNSSNFMENTLFLLFLILFQAFFFSLARAAFVTAFGRAAMDQTVLGNGHRLECRFRILPMTWIIFSNLMATLLSLGLLIPWARVRMMRHLTGRVTLMVQGDLDRFVAELAADVHAVGAGFDDLMNLEIGLA